MRGALVTVASVGLALTGCGDPQPAGAPIPPMSDPAGSTPISGPVVATTTSPVDVAPGGPFDPEAVMRPDLMHIDPAAAAPGDRIAVTFPTSYERGIGYVLERAAGSTWSATHFLTAAYDGAEPAWMSVGEEWALIDVGVAGEGPDALTVPDSAIDGAYRLCLANARENICAPLIITAPGAATAPPGAATVVAVYADVSFYPACGDEQLLHDGVVWYQVQRSDFPALYDRVANAPRERPPDAPAVVSGFAPRVVEPGPGDAVGTLVVWSDDVAHFVSDSGDLAAWLVREELTYDWTC